MKFNREYLVPILIIVSGFSLFGIGVLKKLRNSQRQNYSVRSVQAETVCAEPLQQFCKVDVLDAASLRCLYGHVKDISLECIAKMDICGPEILANCEKMNSMSEYRACVLNRATEISKECQEAEYPCFENTRTLCYGVPRGIELMQCLFKNKDHLSPACLERMREKSPAWMGQKQ